MLRSFEGSTSLTTACGAFYRAAAANASPAHLFVSVSVSVLYHRFFFNVAYADLGMLTDGLQVKTLER